MHPSLHLELYKQQEAEWLKYVRQRCIVAELVRNRVRPQSLEHALSSLLSTVICRAGLWLRIHLALQFA